MDCVTHNVSPVYARFVSVHGMDPGGASGIITSVLLLGRHPKGERHSHTHFIIAEDINQPYYHWHCLSVCRLSGVWLLVGRWVVPLLCHCVAWPVHVRVCGLWGGMRWLSCCMQIQSKARGAISSVLQFLFSINLSIYLSIYLSFRADMRHQSCRAY